MPTPTISRSEREIIARHTKQLSNLSKEQKKRLSELIGYAIHTDSASVHFASNLSDRLQRQLAEIIETSRKLSEIHVAETSKDLLIEITPDEKKKKSKAFLLLAGATALALSSFVTRAVYQRKILNREPPINAIITEASSRIEGSVNNIIFNVYNDTITSIDAKKGYMLQWVAQLCGSSCSRCRKLNGTIAKSFPEYPQLHPSCKCYIAIIKQDK